MNKLSQGPKMRARERGTTSIEVILCLMVLVTIWLSLAQLALVGVGTLVVRHAAHRAARSAIVILDDAPEHFNTAPRQNLLAEGGARLQAIRQAAYAPLSVLAPQLDELLKSTLGGTNLNAAAQSDLVSTFSSSLYNPGAAAVVLERDGEPADSFEVDESVTAHVVYLFSCRVPLARSLLCSSLAQLKSDEKASKLLERVEKPALQDVLDAPGLYFRLLEGKETLPNQGARYHTSGGKS